MAGSYTLPQVKVFQEFAQAPNDVTQNLNPFVIGPNYQLIRYAAADERSSCAKTDYKGDAASLTWAKGYDKTVVDKNWCKVTLENAYASFGEKSGASCLDAGTGSNGTQFEFTMTSAKSLVGDDASKLEFGAPIKAGDYLAYKTSGATDWTFTKIKSVNGGKLSTYSPVEVSAVVRKRSDNSAYDKIKVNLAGYIGGVSGTITLNVVADTSVSVTKAKFTCSSSIAGVEKTEATGITGSGVDIGKGLKIYATEELAAGVYVAQITVHEPYVRDTVTVTDPVPKTQTTFSFVRLFDTVDVDDSFVKKSDAGVNLEANITTKVGSVSLTVIKAKAYLTQRNLLTSHTKSVYSVSSEADITTNGLGAVCKENPLAYALHFMLQNCATATIKYIALGGTDVKDWDAALDRASVSSEVYAFCPLTEDRDIINRVVSHCKTMSTEENKSWRIAFFSLPTDKTRDVTPYVYSAALEKNVPEKCTVDSSKILTCRPSSGNTSTISDAADFDSTVVAGDIVTVVNTAGVEITTKVKTVKSSKTLELEDAVVSADTVLCSFTITHPLEEGEYVDAIAATSSGFRHHRAYNVFPNTLRAADGEAVSGMYGAAAVCALACSVAPQQPITNVEINGFVDIPEVYSTYSRDQLNTIAAGGTLILMQEKMNGVVYVRHQISTAYPDGNLNTTELSLIKNLDSISYYFANRFAPYIGRYNVSNDLLTELEGVLKDGLAYLETTTETNRLIGPQVLVEGTEIRALYASDEKDKVYSNVALNLPAPFNNFDLHLQVI